jgi:hypothetical protein
MTIKGFKDGSTRYQLIQQKSLDQGESSIAQPNESKIPERGIRRFGQVFRFAED